MNGFKNNNQVKTETSTSLNYFNLLKSNLGTVLLISLVIFLFTLLYVILAQDVYKSNAVLKISEPQGKNILDSPFEAALGSSSTDRYIANEIGVMMNRTIREEVARAVIDSFKVAGNKNNFDLLFYDNNIFSDTDKKVRSDQSLAAQFLENVEIKQMEGLSFIEIAVESGSPSEAALIANSYAKVYKDFNLADSRKQLTKLKEFLADQRDEKFNELITAEDNLKVYQIQGGGVELGQQALTLIQTTSQFEADKNRVQIEMSMAKESLEQLQNELRKRDITVSNYMENQTAQPEIKLLREEIASEQIQKTKALAASNGNLNSSSLVEKYDNKIYNLNTKLNELIKNYRSKVLASSPEELKQLTQEIFQAELKFESLKAQYNQLNQVVSSYDRQFNQLPEKTLELARLERNRQSLEKLYTVLDAKYQEALINEQSTPGNVVIMSDARPPGGPSKPNRPLLAILGLILGFGVAFSFVFLRDYFDKTVKTPEDIEKHSANVLAWIPKFEQKIDKSKKNAEIFVGGASEAAAGESYRTLRTRIQFSKIKDGGKSILVTSSAPQEGKTTVSANLAASFAQSNKKTILLDCDLRIPRVNEVFGGMKSPGFTNYLFKQASFDDILRKTDFENLFYIAAGTIPTNPSEILGSEQMKEFVEKLKENFDIVILDSPPVMTITDAEVLSHIVDMSILVVFAEKTEVDWLIEATNQLTKHGQKSFIGTVLNNFDYNSGYRSYNKYNHSKYYSRVDESKQKEWVKS
ncbi:MAG: polysaccharide biosynthesis tyrosine autokinase [Ignavibacteriales bacterium]|nr:polysaccharide biosynthesis tyrosine autokinase [Ignavibacteriales bacterium]